jgi:hypothetical protein
MIKNMSDWYCSSLEIDEREIEYSNIFENILPGINNLDLADNCLNIAFGLDPKNMYTMLLKGMVYDEKRDFENAKKWYLESSAGEGYIAGLCIWLGARAADKLGNKDASELYLKSFEISSLKEIELIYYARNRIANDSIESALQLYSQAIDYNWQSLNELFFDLKDPERPLKIDLDPINKIEIDSLALPKILNYSTDIYEFQSKYYLVPKKLGSLTPFDLTDQGLNKNSFIYLNKFLLFIYAYIPVIYFLLRNKSGYIGRVNRQYLRSFILSSNSIDELIKNKSYNKLSSKSTILVDNFGINYQVYVYLNRYYLNQRFLLGVNKPNPTTANNRGH